MATIEEQTYAKEYTGLISTAGLALGFITLFTIAFETFPRLRRKIARKQRPGHEDEEPSVEDYVMAYLYRPRQFLGKNRGPPLPKWPFAWVWQVLRLSQDWYLRNSGLDAAVYVRFVTGCWYFLLSQLCTTLVITLPLNISYAPQSILPSNIEQASINSLINSTTGGRNYLWVRTVLLWWQAICWSAVTMYVGWGNIRMRREQILDPLQDAKDGDEDEESQKRHNRHTSDNYERPSDLDTKGWRFRTVKVSNIPSHMRNEQALQHYFDSCLTFLKRNPGASSGFLKAPLPSASRPSSGSASPAIGNMAETFTNQEPNGHAHESAVVHVAMVRKTTEIHDLVKKRRNVLHELESAHVKLARTVMEAVSARIREMAKRLTLKEKVSQFRTSLPVKHLKRRQSDTKATAKAKEDLDTLVETLAPFLPVDSKEAKLWRAMIQTEKQATPTERTIWEALSELPQQLLDPYQPVTKLKFFRGQIAPSIDLYLTKLNLLTSLLDELKSKPESYAPCDTAFVTFRQASDARLAKAELSWIRARGLTCRVRMAPDARDLDWDKLVASSFRGDMVRAFFTHAGIWLGTFFWILPISALIGLVSLDNLSTRIPALARWLSGHAKAKSLASSLLPTVIVTITNMLIPTIMIQVSGRAQTFVTLSKLHHATFARYWKWVIINVVIAFCLGTALFTSVLGIFTGKTFSDRANNPLSIISSSFANGAVFFVSYSILVIATQCFFELDQFMIPWFLFLGVRKATTPRQRLMKTEGRRFFSYTVGPNHTLIIAIILVFSLLNPLPICFIFLYFSFACVVFRDHFARLYWRVYYEQNGRLFYIRTMRYSLDALVLGQVVNMSLFFVLKDSRNGGACAALIPLTIILKLVLTRWYDYHMDAADAAFADVVCGQALPPDSSAVEGDNRDSHAGRKLRRLANNNRLRNVKLPELSLRATLRFPWDPQVPLKAKHGPQAALQRFKKRFQDGGSYAELQDIVAKDLATTREQANIEAAKVLAAPSAEKTLEALEQPTATPVEDANLSRHVASSTLGRPEVLPHPKLQRDDRPDFSAQYVDPFVSEAMERYLWLPRDPMYSIDLDDTIEWYGRALVSSEGGNGQLGSWNPQTMIEEEETEEESPVLQGTHQAESPLEEVLSERSELLDTPATSLAGVASSPVKSPPHSGTSSITRYRSVSRILDGSERIRIPDEVKARHTSDAVDDLVSPSTSARTSGSLGHRMSATSLGRRVSTASVATSDTVTPASALSRSDTASRIITTGYPPQQAVPSSSAPSALPRVASEVMEPAEKRSVRRSTLSIVVGDPTQGRDRSASTATAKSSRSRGGEISQSRALAHEAILEERREAVQRRQQEDEHMRNKFRHAKQSWRSWFYKAPDNAD